MKCRHCGNEDCDSLGCSFRDLKEISDTKKKDNVEKSLSLLKEKRIEVKTLNEYLRHYRVGRFDYWPSTGLFWCGKTKEKGRGVFNLIKKLSVKL